MPAATLTARIGFLYAGLMIDLTRLARAAYKSELAAGRKLAASSGIGHEQALRETLERSAGAAGLAQLLDEREAAQARNAARTEARKAGRSARREQARAERMLKHQGPATPWRAWFDGSAHPNPGRCGIGALLTGPGGERIEISQGAGYGNSSEAEYRALIALLDAAVSKGARGLTVYGDSRGVIDDVNGTQGAGAASLAHYRAQALALMARIDGVVLRWLPRHKNVAADALSQRAVALSADADAGHAADADADPDPDPSAARRAAQRPRRPA